MELGNRPSAAALRGRPIPFLDGWSEQLVVTDNGEASAFVFYFFCNDRMAGAADGSDGEALAFVFLFFFCNLCRASISMHGNFLMDVEILCRAPKLTHGKALPCVTIKSARQSAFTVQFAVVCSLTCIFEKNARQSLCHAFYRLCRAAQTHGNPSIPVVPASRE
jgi:hypothetical protein